MSKHITDEALCKNAAHLIAAIYEEMDLEALPNEARDGVEALRSELDAAGYMEPFKREDGSVGVW